MKKGSQEAVAAIAFVAGNPNADARLAMAKAALGRHGNWDDEAKALWQAYASEGAPRR